MNEIVKTKEQVPATQDTVSAIEEWCDGEAADFAPFLKFVKGSYHFGLDDEELPLGTRLIPNMAELRVGFIKWHEGEVLEERIGLVASGKAVRREDLDRQDEQLWPCDENGKRTDPWTQVRTLPMKDEANGAEYVFTTSSMGGNRAIVHLTRNWTRGFKANVGKLPIVQLDTIKKPHKIYGWVHYPIIRLVGWKSEADLTGDTASFLNDEIPDLTGGK